MLRRGGIAGHTGYSPSGRSEWDVVPIARVLGTACRSGVFDHIWVAHHPAVDDDRALCLALELAARTQAHVTVCHILGTCDDEPIDARDLLARELVGAGCAAHCHAEARAIAMRCAPDVQLVSCVARAGAADVLDLVRDARPDLAVVMARGRRLRWLRRLLAPNADDLLVDEAPCPVLVIRP